MNFKFHNDISLYILKEKVMKKYIKTPKKILCLLAIIFIVLPLCSCSKKTDHKSITANSGVIDLKNWNFDADGNINLDGKWQFYWNKLLSPKDLKNNFVKATGYYPVPMYWTKYEGLHLPAKGFATYRLKIKTNGKLQTLGLKAPEIYTEFKLWINGKLIDEHGSFTDGKVKFLNPKAYSFASDTDTIDIVLQVKNYSHGNAGIGQSFILGNSDEIYKQRYYAIIKEMVLIGICCFAGLYHLILFLFRKKEKNLLFFGFFCLAIALRTILTGETSLMEFFPNLQFALTSRISTISVTLCMLTFITFTYYQFEEESPKLLTKTLLILNGIYSIIIAFAPTFMYSSMFQYYFFIIIASAILIIYIAFKCALKGHITAIIFSIGVFSLVIAGINDMLYYLQIIETGYYVDFGFVLFILAQSMLLSIGFANDYNVIKKLSQRLQMLDKLKDDFLANTSHELRTPLNGIIGISESLIDGVTGTLPAKTIENLKLVVSSGKRLSALINDILDYSKLKNNDIIIKNQEVDFKQLVSVVITIIKSTKPNNKVLFIDEISNNLPLVQGDENRLQQIMYNILGNAIKFTKEGYIKVTAEEKNEFIEICVEDTGIGIPNDKLEDIFKPFEQVEESSQREFGGTGLGLPITKKMIELHGGNIWIESEVGKGSKFYFTLKKVSSSSQNHILDGKLFNQLDNSGDHLSEVINKTSFSSTEIEDNSSFKILVVDDEKINLQVISNILTFQNYTIDIAMNGLTALDLIKNKAYDLILLDIMMPKMSGYEVCKQIRKHNTIYELPVIMLTAKNQSGDISTAFSLGANDYIIKPFDKNELLSRIKTQLTLKNAVKTAIDNAYFANIDGLTGLNNRRCLYELAEKEFLASKANASSLSVIMLDIDFFKQFNDTYGHDVGDEVLKNVASNIKKLLKEQYIAGRYGGEEFVIILPNTDLGQAVISAENLRLTIENMKINIKNKKQINCTISLGVATINENFNNIDDLIKAADIMLYKAKENGRNMVCN